CQRKERAVPQNTERGAGLVASVPPDHGLGTPPSLLRPTDSDTSASVHEHGLGWADGARIAFVGVCILLSWVRLGSTWFGFDVVGLGGVGVGASPILREAVTALAARRMTMELSMSIALVAALAIGEVFTALVIVFFVL